MLRARSFAVLLLAGSLGVAPVTAAAGLAASGPAPTIAAAARAGADRLPPAALAHRDALLARLGVDPHLAGGLGQRVIDGTVYQCGPTQFTDWLNRSTASFTDDDRMFIDFFQVDSLPALEALLSGTAGDPAFALGSDAQRLERTTRKTRAFWDVNLSDVQVIAMHGSMLTDRARVARVYQIFYGLDPEIADVFAEIVTDYISGSAKFQGGNHPYFTLNAFAFTSFGRELVPGMGVIPDKIVMGDGMLAAYRDMGYGDVAPQAVLAHEFVHHVQFELGMITADRVSSPEATRRTELHADALAAYYLSHPRGESMQWKRVQQFLDVFFSIGDCAFANDGHHGTPNQRRAAAQWGYEQQENARPRGHVLPTRTLTQRFDAALPAIVAPDA